MPPANALRELRLAGITPDAENLVVVDPETGQRYKLAIDEKLRAAARGDIARFGQIQIETDATMRPRDIQARIRAGASVEEVATESGLPEAKVDRFAYPVLLERSRAAELAQAGHPVREGGPVVQTLAEVVSLAFRDRGHNYEAAEWDAWKDDDGHWIAQLQWQAGRSLNSAHWKFLPDAHGGTVLPGDDAARDLVDPDFGRPLRGLAAVAEAEPESEPEPVAEAEPETPEAETLDYVDAPAVNGAPVPAPKPKAAAKNNGGKGKRGKPAMPSWEDVLLGVRSSGH